MAEKFKVYNRTNGYLGVVTANNLEINIRPGSFAFLTEDDVAYIESNTAYHKRPFATGRLEIEENKKVEVSDSLGIMPDEENHYDTDEEIDKKLKGSTKAMEKWLEDITNIIMLANIVERARILDLPASKLKILDAKVPTAGLLEK